MHKRTWLIAPLVLLTLGGCKDDKWINGKWLLITEEGKPGTCHHFADGVLTVHTSPACDSAKDEVLSGRYELKDKERLAVLRLNEPKAKLALIGERDQEHFVSRGALAGALYRLEGDQPGELLVKLETTGAIKVKQLPAAEGCQQLALELAQIKALPAEESPRMLRFKDQSLQYHVNTKTGSPQVEKVVYAMNQDEVEWVALHLAQSAFNPPGPQGRLEEHLGQPKQAVATGSGAKRQHISMWKAYCGSLRGAANADIDVTLFATTGERRGTIYLSEGVVANIWEELRQTASSPSAADESAGEQDQTADAPQAPQANAAANAPAAPQAEPAAPAPAEPAATPPPPAAAPAAAPAEPAKPSNEPAPVKRPVEPTKPAAPEKSPAPPPLSETGAREGDDDL